MHPGTRAVPWVTSRGTHGNAVPIVKKHSERMGMLFPLLKCQKKRCCKESKKLLTKIKFTSLALHHTQCNECKTVNSQISPTVYFVVSTFPDTYFLSWVSIPGNRFPKMWSEGHTNIDVSPKLLFDIVI